MFMKHALDAAKNCENEIAIGAVIVKDNEIIAVTANFKKDDSKAKIDGRIGSYN